MCSTTWSCSCSCSRSAPRSCNSFVFRMHRADELRHQPRRLDGELVERVRLAAENGEDADDAPSR